MKNRKLVIENLQKRELFAADLFGNIGASMDFADPWPPMSADLMEPYPPYSIAEVGNAEAEDIWCPWPDGPVAEVDVIEPSADILDDIFAMTADAGDDVAVNTNGNHFGTDCGVAVPLADPSGAVEIDVESDPAAIANPNGLHSRTFADPDPWAFADPNDVVGFLDPWPYL